MGGRKKHENTHTHTHGGSMHDKRERRGRDKTLRILDKSGNENLKEF